MPSAVEHGEYIQLTGVAVSGFVWLCAGNRKSVFLKLVSTIDPHSATSVVHAMYTITTPSLFEKDNTVDIFSFGHVLVQMLMENCAVVLGGGMLVMAGLQMDGGGLLGQPLYWAGVLAMGVDSVCSSVLSVVVEKDWATAACKNNKDLLVTANAWVARTDLGVSVASYIVLARLMGMGMSITSMVRVCVGSWPCSCTCVWCVYASGHSPAAASVHVHCTTPPSMMYF